MKPSHSATALLVFSTLATQVGCSASTQRPHSPQVSGPFTPALAALFDDAVDFVEDVEELGGRVASDWRRQLDGLSTHADIICVVRVETVTSGAESTSTGSYRLSTVAVRPAIKGQLPEDRRVDLRVSEGEVGFNTVRSSAARLQSREWLMFVRWYDDVDGHARAHWHLTPATPHAIQRARDAIGYIDPSAPREQVAQPSR